MVVVSLVAALGLAAVRPSAQTTGAAVATVASVDLERYLGAWYEIGRYPNWFQKSCAGDVQAIYATRPDGRLDVTNRCRRADGTVTEARGVAKVVDTTTRAKLKVRFAPAILSWLPMVWGDYWVLGLAPDYSWVTVGTPDRKYLWVLARTPRVDEATLRQALDVAAANGFDVSRLMMTSQGPRPPAE